MSRFRFCNTQAIKLAIVLKLNISNPDWALLESHSIITPFIQSREWLRAQVVFTHATPFGYNSIMMLRLLKVILKLHSIATSPNSEFWCLWYCTTWTWLTALLRAGIWPMYSHSESDPLKVVGGWVGGGLVVAHKRGLSQHSPFSFWTWELDPGLSIASRYS